MSFFNNSVFIAIIDIEINRKKLDTLDVLYREDEIIIIWNIKVKII